MSAVLAFIGAHWRLALALALAGVIWFQHENNTKLNMKLDTATANVAKDDALVKQQNQSILNAKQLADQRQADAAKIQAAAVEAAKKYDATIAWLNKQQPAKGADRCTAAAQLLREAINDQTH
jgi:hypothetical protein